MASITPNTSEPKRPNAAVTQSGVLRSGAKTTSSQSSSELGVPGDYPRDPRIALDNLSDKPENVTENAGGVIDSTTHDLRHAFGVASQYLQDSVAGAVNSVFPSEPTVTAFDTGTPGSRFRKENLAVAGIASDFIPSSSKSRFSTTGVESSSSITPRNSRFNPKDLAIGGIASDFTPSSSKFIYSDDDRRRASKDVDPATEGEETPRRGRSTKPAFTSYAPGPVVSDSTSRGVGEIPAKTDVWDGTVPSNSSKNPFGASTSVPASKERKDNDVEKETATFPPKSKVSDRSTDLRKRAIGTAAVGAGIGAAGGAAYEHSRSESRPSGNYDDKEMGAVEGQQPAFVSYAPAPVITDEAGANDVARSESDGRPSERKRAVETVALGAGIGTVGGATYAHSGSASDHARHTGASQPERIDKSNRAASTSDAKDASSRRDSDEVQPAFATYAPAPVITGDEERSSRDDIEKNVKPTSAVRDEGYHSEGDKQVSGKDSGRDTRMKQGLGAGAIGAGALGGAAYASSRGRGQDFTQETPKGVASDSGTNRRSGTQASDTISRSQPLPQAASNVPGDQVQSQVPPNDSRSDAQPSSEKAAVAAGVGAGAGGAAGVAAAQHNKLSDEEQVKREKEMAKRETEVKQHEKDVAAAKKKVRNVEKGAEKEHRKREKEMREREKEVKKREEATTSAAAAKDRKAKGTEPVNEDAEEGDKDAKKNAAVGVAGAAGGAAVGAGLVNASTDESKKRSSTSSLYSEHSQAQQPSAESKESAPVHPSVKAASAPPQRPGPIALGAAGPNDKAKSGADSDFPLPAENVNDGSRTNSFTDSGKRPGSASGEDAKESGTAVGTEPYRPRSRYHGTEGLQEKQEGGVLRSSTIENMKNGSQKESNADESTSGHGNGNGKGNGGRKEGFVKHIVEKVKDRLHHHDK